MSKKTEVEVDGVGVVIVLLSGILTVAIVTSVEVVAALEKIAERPACTCVHEAPDGD